MDIDRLKQYYRSKIEIRATYLRARCDYCNDTYVYGDNGTGEDLEAGICQSLWNLKWYVAAGQLECDICRHMMYLKLAAEREASNDIL